MTQQIGSSADQIQRNVHIIWDIENVRPPKGKMVYAVSKIRDEGMKMGSIQDFTCFYVRDHTDNNGRGGMWRKTQGLSPTSKRDLQNLGVDFTEIVNRKPEAADKFILTQLLKISLMEKNNATFSVILISGDSDFSRALSILNSFGIRTLLIHNDFATEALKASTTDHISWSKFLGLDQKTPSDESETPPTASPSESSSPPKGLKREEQQPNGRFKREEEKETEGKRGIPLSRNTNRSLQKDYAHQRSQESNRSHRPHNQREVSQGTLRVQSIVDHSKVKLENEKKEDTKRDSDTDTFLLELRRKVKESQKQRKSRTSAERKESQPTISTPRPLSPPLIETISLELPPSVEYSPDTEDCMLILSPEEELSSDSFPPDSSAETSTASPRPTFTLSSFQLAPIIPIFAAVPSAPQRAFAPASPNFASVSPSPPNSPVSPSVNHRNIDENDRDAQIERISITEDSRHQNASPMKTPTRSNSSMISPRFRRFSSIPGRRRISGPSSARLAKRSPFSRRSPATSDKKGLSVEEIFSRTIRSLESDYQPPFSESCVRERLKQLWGSEGGSLSSFERFLLAIQDRRIAVVEGEMPNRRIIALNKMTERRGERTLSGRDSASEGESNRRRGLKRKREECDKRGEGKSEGSNPSASYRSPSSSSPREVLQRPHRPPLPNYHHRHPPHRSSPASQYKRPRLIAPHFPTKRSASSSGTT